MDLTQEQLCMSAVLERNKERQAGTAGAIDCSDCDREQVHLLEAIQPHGVLLVVEAAGFTILRVSENCAEVFGLPNEALIGHPLSRALGDEDAGALRNRMPHEALDNGPCQPAPASQRGRLDP